MSLKTRREKLNSCLVFTTVDSNFRTGASLKTMGKHTHGDETEASIPLILDWESCDISESGSYLVADVSELPIGGGWTSASASGLWKEDQS